MNLPQGLDKFESKSEEVLYSKDSKIIKINSALVAQLIIRSNDVERKRSRICTHKDPDELLHEMIIVHAKGAYIRPHKHIGRSESFHIISGRADVVILDDIGAVVDVIQMGDYRSGMHFYYRLNCSFFHTMLIYSDHLVFQETTMGPFDPGTTLFATWSPKENASLDVASFAEIMDTKAQNFLGL